MSDLSKLFGGAGAPQLSGVSAMPGMDIGQLGTSLAGMNVSSDFGLAQEPDYMGMLSAMGGMGGGAEQQQPPQMMPLPGAQLQAGGGQFTLPYLLQQIQARPTAQALQGLLGGVYGNS